MKDNPKLAGITVKSISEKLRKAALQKYNLYGSEWIKAYFDKFSGGYNVYHKKHQFASAGGGGEAEKIVGKLLAKYNGKQVEFLSEGGNKSADLLFDEQTWDIKYIDNANEKTIRGHIEDARKADNAIFYFTKEEKYLLLKSAVEREKGKLLKGQSSKMPNIYFMDKTGLLILLWKK